MRICPLFGEAAFFLILSESGVASGTRRIEAITGANALNYVLEQRKVVNGVSALLKAPSDQACDRIAALQAEVKRLRKSAEKSLVGTVDTKELLARTETVAGMSVLRVSLTDLPMKGLRSLMDDLRSHLSKQSVILLASTLEDKVSLLLYVSKDLHERFTANALIGEVAEACGGSGGGRPDLAQAGGSNPQGIERAFATLLASLQA